jgi:uncharacterized protein YraI
MMPPPAMKKPMAFLIAAAILMALPFTAPAFEPWAARTTAAINLRTAPGLNGKVITGLDRGARIQVRAEEGDWLQIERETDTFGYIGWVYGKYVVRDIAPVPTPPDPVTGPAPVTAVAPELPRPPEAPPAPAVTTAPKTENNPVHTPAPGPPSPAPPTAAVAPPALTPAKVLKAPVPGSAKPAVRVDAAPGFTASRENPPVSAPSLIPATVPRPASRPFAGPGAILGLALRLTTVLFSCLALILAFKAFQMARETARQTARADKV